MSDKKSLSRRTFILTTLFASVQLTLFGRLYFLQMVKGNKYKLLSDRNRTRTSLLYPLRGNIFDRNMNIMANNKLCYSAMCDPANIVDKKKLINNLFSIFDFEDKEKNIIINNINNLTKSFIILGNVEWKDLIKIEINHKLLKGIYIESYYKRFYNYPFITSHILGYVRNFYVGSKLFFNLNSREIVGFSGLEYVYDGSLKGKQGFVQNEVNSHGTIIRELSRINAISGNDIQLNIDIKLQSYIYKLLTELVDASGATASIMDAYTGELLAASSIPSYDNNMFTFILSDKIWNEYVKDAGKPMLNRFVGSRISPGSVFKLVIIIALLEEKLISPDEVIECKGKITVGDRDFHCWKKTGHGKVDLCKAMASSCNIYMYQMVKRINNINSIYRIANELGLGQGIKHTNFKEEVSGAVPNNEWVKINNLPWYIGDKLNLSIGQGYVSVTPMQIMIMTARIASSKKIVPIFNTADKKSFTNLAISEESLKLVRSGMLASVKEKYGTSHYRLYNESFNIYGKTGTVENDNKDNHSIFTGFIDINNKRYTLSVILEHNISNSSVKATKIASEIIKFMIN